MQKRARGYIGATAFGGRLPPRAPKCVSGETGALARPPRPFQVVILSGAGTSRSVVPAESKDPYTFLRNSGTRRDVSSILEKAIAPWPKCEPRSTAGLLRSCRIAGRLVAWGYPPSFRYIRIIGLAGSLRKVFKNNDLHGKYSGIMTYRIRSLRSGFRQRAPAR